MAKSQLIIALFLALFLAETELSTSHVLKGSVSCIDCSHGFDVSGIQVLVKCDKVKKLASTYTDKEGGYEVELPSDTAKAQPNPVKCLAKITGGPNQLYTARKNSASVVVQAKESGHYTTSHPLKFYKSCPLKEGKCKTTVNAEFGSSKTVDLPLPREWGLAPTSYYVPFFPIIGIP